MFMRRVKALVVSPLFLLVPAQMSYAASTPERGQSISETDIAEWNITVFPSGRNLPAGQGRPSEGEKIYSTSCFACHGDKGQGGLAPALITDRQRHGIDESTVSIANFWPYATTLYDYIRRAMPWQAPRSLTDQQAWDLTAFILARNHLIEDNSVLDASSLPKIRMPNRDGFINRFPDMTPPVGLEHH